MADNRAALAARAPTAGTPVIVVTGIAGNICVLFTAYDAYLRGYRVVVPPCIAPNTAEDTKTALNEMRKVLKAETPLSTELDLFAADSASKERI